MQLKKRIYDCLFLLWREFCAILPIKRGKIVFISYNGMGWGDNPKYIAKEILRQGLTMDLVWLVKNMNDQFPDGIRKVKYNSLKMEYELATAHFIINNVKNDFLYRKKKKQYYIQTWHGGFPLKYIEEEAEIKLPPKYVETSKRESSKTDLLLASCSLDKEIMRNHFWYSGEILTQGIPRNDIYFSEDSEIPIKVRSHLNIPDGCQICLYAPTFRDEKTIDAYNLDAKRIKNSLEQRTCKKWCIIIRLHPNVRNLSHLFVFSDSIIDGSNYPDPQELVFVSDCLITDYSSIMYDFALMKKTVFLYANDLDSYKKERGLRPIYDELPFPFSQNNEELSKAIYSFNKDEYMTNFEKFWNNRVQLYDTGHASETIVKRIKDVMKGSYPHNII